MWPQLSWWFPLLLLAQGSSASDVDETTGIPVSVVTCETTKGEFEMTFYRDWSPNGYDRVMELFDAGYYDHSHFFRVVPKFVVQFGISYTQDSALKAKGTSSFEDDPHIETIEFEYGTISFAGYGRNSRSSQLFVSIEKKRDPFSMLGMNHWETPVGKVTRGMDSVVAKLYSGYGDRDGPKQGPIHEGPEYLEENFPKLDRFRTCRVSSTTYSETSNIPPELSSSSDDFGHHWSDSDDDDRGGGEF